MESPSGQIRTVLAVGDAAAGSSPAATPVRAARSKAGRTRTQANSRSGGHLLPAFRGAQLTVNLPCIWDECGSQTNV